MCVTKHLAATVRTVRHLKFLSRIAKQERFYNARIVHRAFFPFDFSAMITALFPCEQFFFALHLIFVWLKHIGLEDGSREMSRSIDNSMRARACIHAQHKRDWHTERAARKKQQKKNTQILITTDHSTLPTNRRLTCHLTISKWKYCHWLQLDFSHYRLCQRYICDYWFLFGVLLYRLHSIDQPKRWFDDDGKEILFSFIGPVHLHCLTLEIAKYPSTDATEQANKKKNTPRTNNWHMHCFVIDSDLTTKSQSFSWKLFRFFV